ncbi:MAG: tetratricopeptide repeat protein [Opitutaceae bacterium]
MRRSRLLFHLVLAVVLASAGAALDRVAAPAWSATRERQPALRLDSSMAAAGQGVTLALLGGFRALVADAIWIRMYVLWERRDPAGTQSLIQLVTAIDPRPVYFWVNGARILANDLAAWRVEASGGYEAAGPATEARFNREQGSLALAHLDSAMAFHPESAELWIERANIQLHRMRDLEAAAESYRRAWEQPRAPYYAARLHAEMLRRAGRKAEALRFLIILHPSLPAGDEGAARETVLERIRELERALGVPAAKVYQPEP